MAKFRSYPCEIGECTSPALARRMCQKHYARWHEHGDPNVVLFHTSPAGEPAAFVEMAVAYHSDECLLWPFSKNNFGYPQINVGFGKKSLVHRIVCERIHGAPPAPGLHCAHSCGNGNIGCINHRHLRWATARENSADMVAHGRSTRGRGQKLTAEKAVEIYLRAVAGGNQRLIALEFGVEQTMVSAIKHRIRWASATASLIGISSRELQKAGAG